MKKAFSMMCLSLFLAIAVQGAVDFAVTDISTGNDGFIRIYLQNRSQSAIPVSHIDGEKVFLVFYLNNVRRAEYKLKLIPKPFFMGSGKTFIATHFRATAGLLVRAEINLPPLFAEDRLEDNRLEKKLNHGSG